MDFNKLILNLYGRQKTKITLMGKRKLKNQHHVKGKRGRGLTLPNLKTYCKTTTINMTWNLPKEWANISRTGQPKLDRLKQNQLIFDKTAKAILKWVKGAERVKGKSLRKTKRL